MQELEFTANCKLQTLPRRPNLPMTPSEFLAPATRPNNGWTGAARPAHTTAARTTAWSAAAPTTRSAAGSTGLTASAAGATGLTASGTRGSLRIEEGPLVVVVAPEVKADRLALALAADAHHAAGHRAGGSRAARAYGRGRGLSDRRPAGGSTAALRGSAASPRRVTAEGLAGLPGLAGPDLAGNAASSEQLEVVVGDGILVFPAQVMPLHEQIDARGKRAGLHLEEADGADVLLPAEDQFRLLLALRLVAPDGQRHGHQDRHHGQPNEQRGHRIAALTP